MCQRSNRLFPGFDDEFPGYFLFIGKSSTYTGQAPAGLAFLVAYLMTVIFIGIS
jgi:hypothetical protein